MIPRYNDIICCSLGVSLYRGSTVYEICIPNIVYAKMTILYDFKLAFTLQLE